MSSVSKVTAASSVLAPGVLSLANPHGDEGVFEGKQSAAQLKVQAAGGVSAQVAPVSFAQE